MLVSLGIFDPAASLLLPPSTHGRLTIEPVMAARLDAQLRQYAVDGRGPSQRLVSGGYEATEAILIKLTGAPDP